MSYSRWSHSYWYTYWCCPPDDATEDRDNARFEICGVLQFTAKQIRDDIDDCIAKVKAKEATPDQTMRNGYATEADYRELRFLMNEFLEDVNTTYPVEKEQ